MTGKDTIIGANAQFTGNEEFTQKLRVSGTVKGNDESKDDSEKDEDGIGQPKKKEKPSKSKTPALDHFSRNITEMAENGELDPVIGRNDEIERVAQILSRRKKNNPVLIGEPGVGKTAIIEGLAQKIIIKDVPRLLYNKRILSLDLAGLVAGT